MSAPSSLVDAERVADVLVRNARAASRVIAGASTTAKDDALRRAADGLRRAERALLDANHADLERTRATGEAAAFLDRLTLTPARIDAMATGLDQIVALPDPVGETMEAWRRPNGLEIAQVRVPIGVVMSIYESRPNVTADSAGLCLKTANACLLKSGSESQATSGAIADAIRRAIAEAGLPADAVQVVTGGRDVTRACLRRDDAIDVVIARGGEALKRTIMEESRIPVVKHFEGICHLYVDARADLAMAERICLNGKVQRPSVCNALENLLVHEAVAPAFLPRMVRALRAAGCEVRGDAATRTIVPDVVPATDADWDTEYLDLVLSVRVVPSLDEAIAFIARHGTGLAEAIVTADDAAAERFLREVDSAAVFVNASTRFTDGFEFGFGAEVGISTNRLHARGPMGLRELTTYKYQVRGNGQVRE
jgi:glutamate-5-semialdehyde dehydrogenase